MAPAAPRRYHRVDAVAIEQRSDGVAVSRQQPRQNGHEIDGDGALLHPFGAETHRRAQVQQKPGGHVPVLVVHPHVRGLQPRRHIPVDMADVVVVLVFAQIGQVHTEPAEQAAVVAVEQTVQAADHGPLQPQQDLLRITRRLGHGPPAASREPVCAA